MIFSLVVLSGVLLAGAPLQNRRREPKPIPGAVEHRDVRYLPAWRYPEKGEEQRTGQMAMDIVVPEDGKDLHPVLFVVHGGGWSAGTKDEGGYRRIMAYFVERGYVCVGFNYILRPRGIMPQVFWDTETAVRFLRKNAGAYKVDPARFGAIGLSAGGWLISSVGHSAGDLVLRSGKQSWHVGRLWERGWRIPDDDWNESFLRPLSNPVPVYPDEYGRFLAVSMDFHFRMQFASGNSPAMNNWMGQGAKLRDHEQAAVDRGAFEYSETQWTHPRYKGKPVHVPPLFRSVRKDGNESAAIGFDGAASEDAIEQIARFFHHQFFTDPRTPMPAFRPTSRFFKGAVKVRFVMPKMDHEIRYQVLPLEPVKGKPWNESTPPVRDGEWKSWNRYGGPFTLDRHSLVRAVATSPGRRPSTVAEAHFFEGIPGPPAITAPEGSELPPGKTGEKYRVTFTAEAKSPRWFLAGDLVPWSHKGNHYPNNMILDARTGIWSGTPTKPGRYWVQIWVNAENGTRAGYRDYIWRVEGKDLSGGADLFQTPPVDPYSELVHLPKANLSTNRLSARFGIEGIPAVFEGDAGGTLILVPREHLQKARRLIEAALAEWKYRGQPQWR